MLSVPQINSANNPEPSGRCGYCARLVNRADNHAWIGLAERVLRSWGMTSRAALLLVLALAGMVAIVLALGVTGSFTVADLLYFLIRRGHA